MTQRLQLEPTATDCELPFPGLRFDAIRSIIRRIELLLKVSLSGLIRSTVLVLSVVLSNSAMAADSEQFKSLSKDYAQHVHPLLKQFCMDCHSTEKEEGDLDLEQFAELTHIRKSPQVWQKVVEMLDNGEMPPKKSPMPTVSQRRQIRDWVQTYLDTEARAHAGDPGAVVLRRLSNVEYTNTLRDLLGVDLQPAREFPVDGAAGEGFTNVGEALVMSPAMLDKYISTAKNLAAHAVLLPNGFRFSGKMTRRDWTDEILGQIREIYLTHTDPKGSRRVNLQGLNFEAEAGGRIPLASYLTSLISHRAELEKKSITWATLAEQDHLSARYLETLWNVLQRQPVEKKSFLLDRIRQRWATAAIQDVPAIVAEISRWQDALTKFNSVAHFKPWQSAVDPLVDSQTFRLKVTDASTSPNLKHQHATLNLQSWGAVSEQIGSEVVWQEARFEKPGRRVLLLRDVRAVYEGLSAKRKLLDSISQYLAAAEAIRGSELPADVQRLAAERKLDPQLLTALFDYLGIGVKGVLKVENLFTEKQETGGGYAFINGWGSPATPLVVANSSDQQVRIPGHMKPHSVAVHPSPTHNVVVGWRSPDAAMVKVEAAVVHAHPDCGNAVTWAIELRRAGERRRLASGEVELGKAAKIEPLDMLQIQSGDLVSLLVGPKTADHSCDLTEVEMTISESGGQSRIWSLSRDVSPNILSGNPHSDSLGNRDVWYFYQEKITGQEVTASAIPRGSLLDRWRDEVDPVQRGELARQVDKLLTAGAASDLNRPDGLLYFQLTSMNGPVLGALDFEKLAQETRKSKTPPDPFETQPSSTSSKLFHWDSANLVVSSNTNLDFDLPLDLVAGREFVVTARCGNQSGSAGAFQVRATVNAPPGDELLTPELPILVTKDSLVRERIAQGCDEFRRIFPAAVCYTKIVPVDEVVTLVLFHREDEPLARLMLTEAERKRLDELWDELRYVSQDALKVQEAYGQFMEYVTQDGDVRLFEPLRKPIKERADALQQRLRETEPLQLESLVKFASRAYRRPLTVDEGQGLRTLYASLRGQELDHDTAFRLTLARVLMAPSFLYRAESPAETEQAQPVSDWELASRLSYFLWSSMPDEELNRVTADRTLRQPDVLIAQARRMLKDERVRSLATEFGCQWIDIRSFDTHNEKSEQVFPEFAELRGPMYEESILFFIDLFQRNGSILNVIESDYTFLNEPLARHYGIPLSASMSDTTPIALPKGWQRVEGIKSHHRGGVLGMAVLLSKQSGASRTSPILRGNWLAEMLLGEKLPKPPKNVPQLPESELDTNGMTVRQITEKHRAIESCAKCHDRIDPFGFALESFDAIGRRRDKDLAGRVIDTKVQLKDGSQFSDLGGLREYLLNHRRGEFVRQFCRKLLGYALGRRIQLSDEPLLQEMANQLAANRYQFSAALETVLRSQQFRYQRGSKME